MCRYDTNRKVYPSLTLVLWNDIYILNCILLILIKTHWIIMAILLLGKLRRKKFSCSFNWNENWYNDWRWSTLSFESVLDVLLLNNNIYIKPVINIDRYLYQTEKKSNQVKSFVRWQFQFIASRWQSTYLSNRSAFALYTENGSNVFFP